MTTMGSLRLFHFHGLATGLLIVRGPKGGESHPYQLRKETNSPHLARYVCSPEILLFGTRPKHITGPD